MYLFDVNVWVHAHRADTHAHEQVAEFVRRILQGEQAFAYSPLVLSGFLRVVTHPGVFTLPTDYETAMRFADSIVEHPHARAVLPGPSHWSIFRHLASLVRPKGNLVPDTYFAALALEHDCTWVTRDRDYTRFDGLKLKII
jgi:hypothetical protein